MRAICPKIIALTIALIALIIALKPRIANKCKTILDIAKKCLIMGFSNTIIYSLKRRKNEKLRIRNTFSDLLRSDDFLRISDDGGAMKTASWVIVENATGNALFETFNPAIADKINRDKYSAVPILHYLQALNK